MATEADYKRALEEAKKLIQEQEAFIKAVREQPSPHGVIAYVGDEALLLSTGGGLLQIAKPETFTPQVGQTVVCAPQTGAIVGPAMHAMTGKVAPVKKIINSTLIEIEDMNEQRRVFKSPDLKLDEGDRVLLDLFNTVVILRTESAASKYVKTATNVCWNDIGGLEKVKKQLREIIELPLQQPAIFEHYGYKPPRGVLLSGPPGCGKTMLGKAVATAVANGGDSGFIYVKGPEVLNRYVGASEERIRSLFDQARAHKRKTGVPAVIFIDEAESLLSKRGSGKTGDMERTIVPAFLAEMDGLEETSAVVILATNRPDQLDPAVVRDGRIDRKVAVTRPDVRTVGEIAMLYLKSAPVSGGVSIEDLVIELTRRVFSPDFVVRSFDNGMNMILGDMVSGAMIANVVGRAKSEALNRDLENETMTGITIRDIQVSVEATFREAQTIDTSDEVRDFLAARGFVKSEGPVLAAA